MSSHWPPRRLFLRILVVFFFVHRFLRNLTYVRTCWIISSIGIFTFTYLNISKIWSIWTECLLDLSLFKKEAIELVGDVLTCLNPEIDSVSGLDVSSISIDSLDLSGSLNLIWLVTYSWDDLDNGLSWFSGVSIWLSTCFPDLKVWIVFNWLIWAPCCDPWLF